MLPEPEIHARLVEALGALTDDDLAPLRAAAGEGRAAFADAFFARHGGRPAARRARADRALPHARSDAARRRRVGRDPVGRGAPLRAVATRTACAGPASTARGSSRRGAVRRHPRQPVGRRVHRRRVEETLARACAPTTAASTSASPSCWPSSTRCRRRPRAPTRSSRSCSRPGERRSFTANTIFRDPAWRKRDAGGALRVSPDDAARLGLADGGRARLTTRRAQRRGGASRSTT